MDCNISNNDANGSGGGIYISNKDLSGNEISSGSMVLMKNCLITGNVAARDGAGISANWHSEPNIVSCTIADNNATGDGFSYGYGGGINCSYGSYARILNSIVWRNLADIGLQMAIGTAFEHDPRPSTVEVSYSNIQGGAVEPGVFVDTGDPSTAADDSELIWDYSTNLAGTADDNPLFVTRYIPEDLREYFDHYPLMPPYGQYYLSQPYADPNDPNQTELSPCVDAGSDTAFSLGMCRHTTRTDGVPEAPDSTVDLGYHYILTTDLIGDYNFDFVVDSCDLALFNLHWLEQGCDFPDWCCGADLNQDGIVNFLDYVIFAKHYGATEETAPVPDPMTWAFPPASAGSTSISMTATTAYDNSTGWDVEYYFECVYGGGHDRDWDPDPTYTDTGLVEGNTYGYKVKARDTSANQNETEWSVIGYAVAGGDSTPPVTDPDADDPYKSTWDTPPYPTSGTSIRMVATEATDVSGVEYYFQCTFGPGHNSGWQSSRTYEDPNLLPYLTYTYRVRTRDKYDPPNYGNWSDEASADTPEGDPPAPIQWAELPEEIYGGGGNWDFYATMTAEIAEDPSQPVEYYFQCTTESDFSSGWQDSPVYTVPVGASGQAHRFRFRARDAYGNESDWSSEEAAIPRL
jgi:hypothetical protein